MIYMMMRIDVLFNDVIDVIIEDVLYKDEIILVYDVDNDEIIIVL